MLLTDDEVRDYRVYLTGVKGYEAATVNASPTWRRSVHWCALKAERSRSKA